MICFPDLKRYVAEWQKNLVRFLLGKKEFGLGYFTKLFNLMYILSILIFIFLIYDPSGQFPEVLPYPILFGMALILLLLRFLLSMYKLRQANLPEFKVEEYRERLELIEEAHL
ncbi:MAG: hypothetical protein GYA51_04275 [Candidatus Methanofastidiosa archaeon]|nr:hypothetical protein [Candidatus Methanofastidiosa archaeon]